MVEIHIDVHVKYGYTAPVSKQDICDKVWVLTTGHAEN
jgi:hypothetical protein